MIEIIPKLSHRELLFGIFATNKPHVFPLEVRTMNDELMPLPWCDEWFDIGGEG